MKFDRPLGIAILATLAVLMGCQPTGKNAGSEPAASTEAVNPDSDANVGAAYNEAGSESIDDPVAEPQSQEFAGTGVVRNITPSRTYIVIEHSEISGYMGAMTMPFAIKDQDLIKTVAVGDSIDFKLTVSASETYVSEIEKAARE